VNESESKGEIEIEIENDDVNVPTNVRMWYAKMMRKIGRLTPTMLPPPALVPREQRHTQLDVGLQKNRVILSAQRKAIGA